MKHPVTVVFALVLACWPTKAAPQAVSGSLPPQWRAGVADCATQPQPPLQVHAYEAQTVVIRENPCVEGEGNFMYLLIGASKALLVDTGPVAESARVPLATTVLAMLPGEGAAKVPLLVVHTHGHTDHRSGDLQFANLPGVTVVATELPDLQRALHLEGWPEGQGTIDLGDRWVDVIPTPGHHPAHVVLYDRRTQLLLSGDFLMPGRLLIEDRSAFHLSAQRVAAFARGHSIAHVLGSHIELDDAGTAYAFGSSFHPHERPLQLDAADIAALPAALRGFNGFYETHPHYVLSNPAHNLAALAAVGLACLMALAWGVSRFRRRRRSPAASD